MLVSLHFNRTHKWGALLCAGPVLPGADSNPGLCTAGGVGRDTSAAGKTAASVRPGSAATGAGRKHLFFWVRELSHQPLGTSQSLVCLA